MALEPRCGPSADRRIAFIGDQTDLPITRERLDAYRDRLGAVGVPDVDDLVRLGATDPHTAQDAAQALMRRRAAAPSNSSSPNGNCSAHTAHRTSTRLCRSWQAVTKAGARSTAASDIEKAIARLRKETVIREGRRELSGVASHESVVGVAGRLESPHSIDLGHAISSPDQRIVPQTYRTHATGVDVRTIGLEGQRDALQQQGPMTEYVDLAYRGPLTTP